MSMCGSRDVRLERCANRVFVSLYRLFTPGRRGVIAVLAVNLCSIHALAYIGERHREEFKRFMKATQQLLHQLWLRTHIARTRCADLPRERRPAHVMGLSPGWPTYTERMLEFMRNVSTLKAFVRAHCMTTTLNTDSDDYQQFANPVTQIPAALEAEVEQPAGADVDVCINMTDVQASRMCAFAHARWCFSADPAHTCACITKLIDRQYVTCLIHHR